MLYSLLGGGFEYFICSPLFGEMIHVDENIFQMGWNHQLGFIFGKTLAQMTCLFFSYMKLNSYGTHAFSLQSKIAMENVFFT